MSKEKQNKKSHLPMTVIGASLAGLAATAYFFMGSESKKRQKYAKAWAIKMKGDVVEKLEKAREISEPVYQDIINTIAAKHSKKINLGTEEVNALAQDLKKHWKIISGSAQAAKKDVLKDSKKIVKKLKKPVTKIKTPIKKKNPVRINKPL